MNAPVGTLVAAEERINGQTMAEAFPDLDPEIEPVGSRIVVQLIRPRQKSQGGILIPDVARDDESWTAVVGRVVSIGPAAYHDLKTGKLWPEGAWHKPGDFVLCPRYGGQRIGKRVGADKTDIVTFVVFEHTNTLARITGDPRRAQAL